jgi:hypothetical protein
MRWRKHDLTDFMRQLFQGMGRNWVGIVFSLILAITSFGLGYWQGQRSHPAQQGRAPSPPLTQADAGQPPAFHPAPPMPNNGIPPNASPELKEFLENRAKLAESFAKMRSSHGTNGAPNPQAFAQFQQQNKALLDRQRELAQELAQQQAKNPIPTPPPLRMPPDASPQLQAFLTTRDQLMRDQIAFMNEHRTDEPQARQAVIQQWRQQNASRFTQLQQESQALSHSNSSPTNAPTPH